MTSTQPICFEDVEVGQPLPDLQLAVNRTKIVQYAGAGGDYNPLHHDDEFAKAAGFPSVLAMGLMSGSTLSRVLTRWAGPTAVKRYKMRFVGMVWPGDDLVFSGKVSGKLSRDGEGLVTCDLLVNKANGEVALQGSAELALPVRDPAKEG